MKCILRTSDDNVTATRPFLQFTEAEQQLFLLKCLGRNIINRNLK